MNRGGPVPEQLQASRDLVNEGLSGLVPRAKVLLTVGAAVPTAFVGLISVAVCVFAVLALGLEGKFIHGAGVLLLFLLFLFFGVFEREERGEREERRERREERGKRGRSRLTPSPSLFF
jgi:fatty acid desaturase